MARVRPVGTVTRGTTNPNRLRRCDRWLVATQRAALRTPTHPPLVVDLGYGASPITAVELRNRLRAVRPDVRVVGVEIEPSRVAVAKPLEDDTLSFRLGGFELPVEGDVDAVRAFNVLRQYDESQVAPSWRIVQDRLSPTGIFVEGTCDEIGRLATWVTLDREAPRTLTLSWRLGGLETPSVIAERLPKVLIHRNVDGEPVHRLLRDLDRAWATAAPHASYGARQRFLETVRLLRSWGWPVRDGARRHRLGELTLDWAAVAPNGSDFGRPD